MLSRKGLITCVALGAIFLAPVGPVRAQAEDPDAYGDDYYSGDFGRVRFLENGGTIVRANPDPAGPAEDDTGVNSPIFPGDEYRTAADQRAEVELASGTLVRIDRTTRLTFLALPSPSAAIADDTVLQLFEGTVRIAALAQSDEEFRIDTPSASVYLLGEGDFRIEVDARGTEVLSRRGVAELSGNGGSVLVRGGSMSRVYPGSVPEEAVAFNTFGSDGFDAWVADRDAAYRAKDTYAGSREVYEQLPNEVRPYYTELSVDGSWYYADDYGYVWTPRYVAPDWRPYRDGYWSYGPSGYFWVSWEPWGWAPYHYGRWTWIGGRGWCWIPGRVFAGAWVAWSWGSLYLGWSPLDYWNRPCYVRSLHYGYYDPYAWTFISYRDVNRRHYARHAVRVSDIHDLAGSAVVTRPPRVSPRDLETSEKARNRARERVAADRGAWLQTVRNDERPKTNMRDLERRISGRRTGFDGRPTSLGQPDRGAGTAGRPSAGARPPVKPQLPVRPRLTSGSANPGRERSRATTRPGNGSDDARRRDLYDRMSSPRRTRDRSTAGETRRNPAPTGARDRTSGTRDSSKSTPSRAVPTRTRDNGRSDKATGSRSSDRSRERPKATDRSKTPSRSSSGDRKRGARTPSSSARPSSSDRPSTSPPRSSGTSRGSTARPSNTPRPPSSAPRSSNAPRPRSSTARSSSRPRPSSAARSGSASRSAAPRTRSRPSSGGSRSSGAKSKSSSSGSRSKSSSSSRGSNKGRGKKRAG